jgi:glycosyltransferase involved in cell wall biosynthesis
LSNRQEFRSKYKISSNAKLLLYTGRISYQKNIEALIKIFNSLTYMIDDDCYLLLAGSWDDILLPFFGKYGICGSFYNHISKLLTQKQLKKIIFLGNLNIIELKEVYHASDLFVSLSTYNDEDFGMSPAEALCCGLPCLLSDWAGYSSFKKYSEVVKYVPIEFETIRPTISFSKSRSTLMELISNLEFDESFLHKNSKYSLSSLSIESVSNTLKTTITNINFEKEIKFSENFDKLCLGFYANRNHPFSEKLYREVYQVYGF